MEGAAARRRDGRARPRQAADAPARDPGRQASRQAVAHHDRRPERRHGRPISSTATSPPTGPTSCGSPTSPTCAAGRAWCSSASSSTLYSRRIVGWQFASHMRTDLVLDALRMALDAPPPGADVELVHHSDAGSQYTSYDFTQVLDDHGVLAVDRLGRRRLRQRHGRELRRQLQDRADRRPRLAHPHPARARDRRVRRLVQRPTVCTAPSATSHPPSSKPNTLPRQDRLRRTTITRKPPNPVSAEPSPAHLTPTRPSIDAHHSPYAFALRVIQDLPSTRPAVPVPPPPGPAHTCILDAASPRVHAEGSLATSSTEVHGKTKPTQDPPWDASAHKRSPGAGEGQR